MDQLDKFLMTSYSLPHEDFQSKWCTGDTVHLYWYINQKLITKHTGCWALSDVVDCINVKVLVTMWAYRLSV